MTDHTGSEHLGALGTRHRSDPVGHVVVAALAEWESARPDLPANVVDVGGGSGADAVQIARRGHRVTVVDPSANALATLERRAADAQVADQIVAAQGEIGSLSDIIPVAEADFVLCHGVLEVVDEPLTAIRELATVAARGAVVSVVVTNRHGAVAGRVITGHLTEALAIAQSTDGTYGPHDPLPRRFTVDAMRDALADAGLTTSMIRGSTLR